MFIADTNASIKSSALYNLNKIFVVFFLFFKLMAAIVILYVVYAATAIAGISDISTGLCIFTIKNMEQFSVRIKKIFVVTLMPSSEKPFDIAFTD